MDLVENAKFLLTQVENKEILEKIKEISSSNSFSLYGENPRKNSVRFAREQAKSRKTNADMGIINAFGMNHLIEQLKKRQDEEEIYFYYIKTESHVGEIYFLKDFLIGFQFVERRCEKYIKGCNPDML